MTLLQSQVLEQEFLVVRQLNYQRYIKDLLQPTTQSYHEMLSFRSLVARTSKIQMESCVPNAWNRWRDLDRYKDRMVPYAHSDPESHSVP